MNSVLSEIMAIDVYEESDFAIKIGEQVNYNDKNIFQNIFRQIYVNSKKLDEPLVRKEMQLTLTNEKPFACAPRRLSYSEKVELQKIIDEYLAKGYIRPSESEFVSPIVLVKKKTGELRLCVDYRKLNKVTAKDNYPMPLIDDLLDRLANKKVFTKLDLKNGFFHVFVNKDSVKYTSFITPLGQYEFLRMPFGLKNAPATFQKFINKIFADMIRSGEVIVYLDDIMIATENVIQYFKILKKVLLRIVQNNLELRLDKCEFLQSKVSYLDYVITGEGIQADKKGLRAIENFSVPIKVQEVQSFLGLCSYFRRFIKDFSTIAKPLHDLTKKDRKFKFGEIELESFNSLKVKLINSPLLAIYDPSDETELHCDASALGFGAILLQRKKDKKLHPVFYFSKRTTDAESKYHSFELETLAIIYALKRFRIYLQGKKFKIVTDCNSLTLTLNKKDMNPRIARWALELQNYDYELEHRAGKRMQHVDALSRVNNVLIVHANTFEENLVICQSRDERIRKIKEELEIKESKCYEMRNGIVYKKKDKELLFYVPESMETHVLYKYHDEMGHLGIDKVVQTIGKSYWFPGVKQKATIHIENCLKCIAFSNKSGKKEGLLNIIPKGNVPFEMIHIDHYGPINSRFSKYKHVLVVIDAFTKFVRLYPSKTTASKEAVSALREYFRTYSRPKFIVSDRGTCFTSNEFEEFLENNKVEHIKVATNSPQANGQAEIVNKSLGPMIAKLTDSEENVAWEKVLESVEYAMNNTVHKSTKEEPSKLLFGVRQKGKVIDGLRESLESIQEKKLLSIENVRSQAQKTQSKSQNYNKEYSDAKRKEPRKFKVGDYVVTLDVSSQTGVSSKLIPKFKGPYRVSEVLKNDRYVVEDVEGFQQTQIPYRGTWSITNLKPWYQYRSKEQKTVS
ncbi:unnamed protein product [Ceratitis capitata]|uniref:RNA-directed DNA polymerase n=1 Tax=Ceratitis capitata TaxID=7213 RepID=A0A811UUK1_CERCA|nr:unnamed protein product [Ceratitis capitata]